MKSGTGAGSRFPAAAKPKRRRKPPRRSEKDKEMLELLKRIFGRSRASEYRKHVITHLHHIEQKLETIMATAAELNAKVDRLNTAVDNIRQDITDIKNGLPSSGGMTQAEVDALDTRLGAVVDKTEALDAENPAPPAP